MSEFIIRKASRGDSVLLQQLERHAFAERSWGRKSVAESFDAPGVVVLLGPPASAPAGFVILRFLPGEAEILSIGVVPDARQKGLGAALMRGAISHAQKNGAASLVLEVDPENQAATALYAAQGFEECGRRKAYYRNGADAIVMRKTL